MARQNYQVLARKWRPQLFEDVVGQQAVVRTLANALGQGRIAHAYCFSGIRGVGKTTLARLLARGLNCRASETPTATPCGECEACVEIMESRALDVFERDAASDRGINEMKELIEIARYAPSRDRYKVMILDEAHMLTTEASNALLKVLEEPPEYIVFVLATTEPNKILPTILSRCQHYQFARISQRDIGAHLGRIAAAESVDISADGLALIAAAADGSLRDAQSLLDKLIAFAGDRIDEATVVDLLGLVDRMLLYRATDLVAGGDIAGVLGFVNEMVEQGIDLHQFTIDLLGHFRNLLVVHSVDDPGAILHLPSTDIDRLRLQAEQFEVDDLDRGFALLASNEYRIKVSEQPRYHVEVALARLARMPRLEPIQSLIESIRSPSGSGGGPGEQGGNGSRHGTTSNASSGGGRRARPAAKGESVATPAAHATSDPDAAHPGQVSSAASRDPDVTPAAASDTEAAPAVTAASNPDPAVPTGPPVTLSAPPPTEELPPLPPEPDAPPEPTRPSAPNGQPEPTVAATRAAPQQHDAPHGPPAGAPAGAAAGGDHAHLLGLIQQSMEASHPLVAQVLGRSCGIDVDDKTMTLRFPSSASIFAQRVRDPQILPALSAACSSAAGRTLQARVELDDSALRGEGSHPEAGATNPPAGVTSRPPATMNTPGQPAGNGARAGVDDVQSASSKLLERAEGEPLVQDLLRELKGQVISVEES